MHTRVCIFLEGSWTLDAINPLERSLLNIITHYLSWKNNKKQSYYMPIIYKIIIKSKYIEWRRINEKIEIIKSQYIFKNL